MRFLFEQFNRIVLWGQGRKLVKLFDENQAAREMDFFYVDSSPAKKGKDFYGLTIHSPIEITRFKPDAVILAVGDANMLLTQDKCKEILEIEGNHATVITLGEMMNPNFSFEGDSNK